MLSRRIAIGAIIIMAGSILSRVLGLGRESTIAALFGGKGQVDAFTVAAHVSTIIYDLLISGMVSAALVPVLSEYAEPEKREELGRILGVVLTGALIVVVIGVGLLELFPEPLVEFMSAGLESADRQLALDMTRIVLPGVVFLGISAVLMSALYALQRFSYPSFAMASQNLAIILAAFLLSDFMGLGVRSLAYGMLLGSVAMVLLQWPGLRDVPIKLSFDFNHPAVRRILKLYAPIALSLVVSAAALILDRHFATLAGEGSVSAMRYATTLTQFGLGIVGAAISLAALPSLSQHFTNGDDAAYRRTLGTGLRTVTVLSLPTAATLFFLSIPIVSLILQRGAFLPEDKAWTVLALVCYVIALPAAAIDQVLIFGFYSRKNTVIPVTIGICASAVYTLVALTVIYGMGLRGPQAMAGLVLASSAQWTFHAIVSGVLLYRNLGGLPGERVLSTAIKAGLGSLAMGLVGLLVWLVLGGSADPRGLLIDAITLGISVVAGGLAFVGVMALLRVPEVAMIMGAVRRRLPGGKGVAQVEGAADEVRATELAATYDENLVSTEPWAGPVAAQAAAQPVEEELQEEYTNGIYRNGHEAEEISSDLQQLHFEQSEVEHETETQAKIKPTEEEQPK